MAVVTSNAGRMPRIGIVDNHGPKEKAMNVVTLALCSALAFWASEAVAQPAGPTDAQIAAIVVAANQVDIDAGKLAISKANAKDVKAFAQQMITDHTGVNKQATELVTKLKVKPEENDTSRSLKRDGAENIARLQKLKGADFDRAYIAQEVAYHQAVIDALDKTLVPNAKNEELKALLVKVRPAFVAHMEHAKSLQGKVAK